MKRSYTKGLMCLFLYFVHFIAVSRWNVSHGKFSRVALSEEIHAAATVSRISRQAAPAAMERQMRGWGGVLSGRVVGHFPDPVPRANVIAKCLCHQYDLTSVQQHPSVCLHDCCHHRKGRYGKVLAI